MKYQPIDCNFYDILEATAVKRLIAEIIYSDDSGNQTVNSRILNLYTKNKEEFMVLENELTIRLDQIISVNGEVLQGFCKIP